MRVLRGMLGALLWILGSVLGLVALLLCVTVILLPLGLPLLRLSRQMIGRAARLMMPRPLAHPVQELGRSGKKAKRRMKKETPSVDVDVPKVTKKAKKRGKKLRKKVA